MPDIITGAHLRPSTDGFLTTFCPGFFTIVQGFWRLSRVFFLLQPNTGKVLVQFVILLRNFNTKHAKTGQSVYFLMKYISEDPR